MSDSQRFHLGVDLSTTSVRCLVLNEALEEVGRGSGRHSDLATSLSQNGSAWIDVFESAFGDAIRSASVAPADIASIGVATQGVTAVPVTDQGKQISLPRVWLGGEDGGRSGDLDRTQWYERSGRYVFGPFLASRLVEGGTSAREVRWCLAGDFLVYHLTGVWVVGPGLASTTGLVDPSARDWSDELLGEVRLTRRQLSRIGEPGEGATVPAKGPLARRLGMQSSTPVAFPTQDQRAAGLMSDPYGEYCTVALGTAGAVFARADTPSVRSRSIPLTPGLGNDVWWLEGVVLAAGLALDWVARLIGCSSTGEMLDLASAIAPGEGSVEFIPGVGGVGTPDWQARTTSDLLGLSLSDGREQVARAVVDGVCELIVRNIEEVRPSSTSVRLVGRTALHDVVSQALATRLGEVVSVVRLDEPTGIGSAVLGAYAGGFFDSLEEAVLAFPERSIRLVHPVKTREGNRC